METVTIGSGNEGRALKGVIIDFKSGQRETPLIGMIEGGIHAREWISPATVTWIIKEFLTSDNPDVRFMAEAFVWHVFPVVNPDGYEYTFTHVSQIVIFLLYQLFGHFFNDMQLLLQNEIKRSVQRYICLDKFPCVIHSNLHLILFLYYVLFGYLKKKDLS